MTRRVFQGGAYTEGVAEGVGSEIGVGASGGGGLASGATGTPTWRKNKNELLFSITFVNKLR